ncbi:MAG: VCBS repeat-containing protein, partial [Gemmatimonadetes bacterium]|nr:VCBS repeat-containing protein [Gemmatimonadota bacterium]
AWADYDLDGDVDVYVSRTIGFPNSLYRNDGNFRFTDVAVGPVATTANTQGVAWGDYDDDGDPDLYVTAVGPNLLLRNDGGAFVNVATGVLADASITRDAAWGDADGDGDLDLALANYGSSDKLLRNVGGGAFVDATPPAMVNTDQSNSVTWQDVDLDSDLDLFVATTTTNHLLLNDGGGVWAESIGGPFPRTDPYNSFAGAFADMDSDGDPDVLVVNRGGEADQLFRNDDGAGEHWLAIDVKGTLSNTGGVGARIDLTAGGVTQRRDVGYDAPISSQGTKRALFGLGANTSIESISIRWPSGHVQVVSPPAVDQRIVVTENDPTGPELPDRRPERFALGRPFPNPFVGGTSLPLEAPRRTRATVEVFDVRGRRVRTVLDGPVEPGVTAVRWDGRDSEGARAAAGIYFVRCRAGEFTASRKITLR